MISADLALERLKNGNRDFVAAIGSQNGRDAEQLASFAIAADPGAVCHRARLLGCARAGGDRL